MNDIKEIIRGISEIGWLPVIVTVAIIGFAIYVLSSGVKGKYTDPNYQEPERDGNGLLGRFRGAGNQGPQQGPGMVQRPGMGPRHGIGPRPGTGPSISPRPGMGPQSGSGSGIGARPGMGQRPGGPGGPGSPGRFGSGGSF